MSALVLEGFAGPGGWSTGLRWAGYTGDAVGIELDTDACATAQAAGHARIRADVAAFPLDHYVGHVTGLIMSPPCPTFSTAGDGAGKVDLPNVLRLIADFAAGRQPGDYQWVDERSRLTAEPMRYVKALMPRLRLRKPPNIERRHREPAPRPGPDGARTGRRLMRIRSVKPEFWSSEDVAALSRENRLLFLGLWSYVDDNGVGRDDYRLIVADLFPLDDPGDARDYVRDGLATLSRALLIARYEVDGRAYLSITGWHHQRIDKPAKPRYPQPPEGWTPPPTSTNGTSRETVATLSRDRRETVAPGTGEQGNRGTGEAPSAPRAHAGTRDPERDLVDEWIASRRKRPPRNVIQQTARWVRSMLREGIDPDDIRAGLRVWADKGMSPSVLPSIVNEVMNAAPAPARATARRRTTDDKRAAIPDLVDEVLRNASTSTLRPDLRAISGGQP